MNEVVAPPAVSVPSVTPAEPIVFSGVRSDFRRLVLRGALLELVTVGFYRFWLATDMRRHLWSHTSVGGDALEYTGTAKELLIGFLFALAVLVPIYLVYTLIGIQAEQMQAFASIPLVLFYYLFAQFAIYRARRYRLTRTVWRGVRFWMEGSGWSYAWRASLWALLAIVTLGIALPWRETALERFKMRHSYYGDLQGRFDATGWQLFAKVWWMWIGGLVFLFFALAMVTAAPVIGAIMPLIFLVIAAIVYPIYKAIEWRWWASGIRFGQVRFESDLPNGRLIGLYLKVLGWFLLLIIIFSLIITGGIFAVGGGNFSEGDFSRVLAQQGAGLAVLVFSYVVLALGATAIMRIYLVRDIWARVAATARVHNLAAADNVAAKGHMVGALGEGLADSLDIGGF